jgi:uncharacterized protein
MMRLLGIFLLTFLGFLSPVRADLVAVPTFNARVIDLTATLSAPVRDGIEARLADLESRKGSQLAVLLIPSTGDEAIEQYSLRVAEAWKLGRKDVDDGVLLLLAKDDRKLRIEVGYGLEGAIPDAIAKRVIAEVMVPHLKTGDFEGAINAGVDRLIGLIDGEPLPEVKQGPSVAGSFDDIWGGVLVFVFIVGGILRKIFGPLLGAGIAGSVAFFGAWLVAGGVVVAGIVAGVVFVLTLLGVVSLGGGGSSSGGGGGGFGGGGGGGFGGGGASGSW